MAGRGSCRRRLRGGAVRLRPRRDFRRVAGDQGGLFAQPLDGPGGDELGHAGRPGGLARRRRAERWDRPQAHAAARWRAVHFRSCRAVVGVRRGDPCRGPIHRWHRRRRGRRRGAALCGRIGAGEPARPFHLQLSARDHSRHLPGLSGQRPTRRRRAVGERRLANDARSRRRAGAGALPDRPGRAGIVALADDDGPPRRRRSGLAQGGTRCRRQARIWMRSSRRCGRTGRPPRGARFSIGNGVAR